MGLLDESYKDKRLSNTEKKTIKPAIQGGGPNYLGKQEEVTVPKKWLSDPDHVVAELAYITPKEKKILLEKNLYGSLKGKPNTGPAGIQSLQGDMGSVGGGSSGGNGDNNREQYGAKGQYSDNTSKDTGGGNQVVTPPDRPTIADITGDTLPESFGPVDPGVEGNWTTNKKTGELEFTPSTDSIKNYADNLIANLKSNPYGLLTPTATMLSTAYQTARARQMMGYGFGFTGTGNVGGVEDNNDRERGDHGGDGVISFVEDVLEQVSPYLPESAAKKYYDNLPQTDKTDLSFLARYNNIKNDVNGILNSPSPLGLLAVNESPFYDFLKIRGLDRRIL